MHTLQSEGEEMALAKIDGPPRTWNTAKAIATTEAIARTYFRR